VAIWWVAEGSSRYLARRATVSGEFLVRSGGDEEWLELLGKAKQGSVEAEYVLLNRRDRSA